ncbi:MAG: hypothetical protein EBR99_00070 [Actinobacteria bacterium]|nr:hypothetical protein [Actinomycetota bacterium]
MAWNADHSPDPDFDALINDDLRRHGIVTDQTPTNTAESTSTNTAENNILRAGIRPEFIVVRDGKPFVLYAGLLDLAHRVGLVGIETSLVQSPVGPHYTAIVHARASKLVPADGTLPDRVETYDGIGDANEANTNRIISVHQIRLAETRAKARALRDLTNVGVTALEELGGEGPSVGPISVVAGPAAQQWERQAVPVASSPDATRPTFAPSGPASDSASDKQRWLVLKLLNEQGLSAPPSSYETKAQAKDLIDSLIKKTYGGAR